MLCWSGWRSPAWEGTLQSSWKGFWMIGIWFILRVFLRAQKSLEGSSVHTRRLLLLEQGLWGLMVLINLTFLLLSYPPSLLMGWPEDNSQVKLSI